jgi:hypothetical protein
LTGVPVDGSAGPAQASDVTGDPPPLSRFELAAAELRGLGITVTRLPGEYRVNYRTGTDATARTVETLDQALELGRGYGGRCSGTTRPGAREARPTTAPHDPEGDLPPYDPGAQSPHARAGLAKKGARPRHRTGFPK